MRYKVNKQYPNAGEIHCAQFKDIADARFFIEKKLAEDTAMKIAVIYRLCEFDEVLTEYDSTKTTVSSAQSSSAQGTASTSGFRPTPFNTAPKPSGMPNKWNKDEEEEK